MLNIHIGLPGIAPELLHSIEDLPIFDKKMDKMILSKKCWHEQFRSTINSKNHKRSPDMEMHGDAKSTILKLSEYATVAVSQHAILGKPTEIFQNQNTLPYATSRVQNISRIFSDLPLTFHLTLLSQYDYLQAVLSRASSRPALDNNVVIPSWSALVRRIKQAAPDRQLVVWDFERPEKICLAFTAELLDERDPASIDTLGNRISSIRAEIINESKAEHLILPEDVVEKMDVAYDVNLREIDEIEGVILVRSDAIPEWLHL